MTKKLLLLIGGTLAACMMTLGLLAILPPRSGVTKANFDRIENGMTFDEVVAVFGEKPSITLPVVRPEGIGSLWENDDYQALVVFSGGKIQRKRWFDRSRTVLKKIRCWLRLDNDESRWPEK